MNRRRRTPALPRVLVRVPGCLLLASGLVLGAAGAGAAADGWADPLASHAAFLPSVLPAGTPAVFGAPGSAGAPGPAVSDPWDRSRVVPVPPSGDDLGGAVLAGRVTPLDTQVGEDENGDFTLSVTNMGTVIADNVRVLLDDATADNPVGSPDGRCLSRLDANSPADLWCELGDVEPLQTVSVQVHAFMNQCVWLDPDGSAQRAPAFRWRVGYIDGGRSLTMSGPTPRWSCAF
jgi:hypothetical protein